MSPIMTQTQRVSIHDRRGLYRYNGCRNAGLYIGGVRPGTSGCRLLSERSVDKFLTPLVPDDSRGQVLLTA